MPTSVTVPFLRHACRRSPGWTKGAAVTGWLADPDGPLRTCLEDAMEATEGERR